MNEHEHELSDPGAMGVDAPPGKGRCTCGCDGCWKGEHCGGRWCN